MVSTGADMRMAVWDIRMFKEVNKYFTRTAASSVAISATGLTAVACGSKTTVWKGLFEKEKVQSPYMCWETGGSAIQRTRWCPFEDILGRWFPGLHIC